MVGRRRFNCLGFQSHRRTSSCCLGSGFRRRGALSRGLAVGLSILGAVLFSTKSQSRRIPKSCVLCDCNELPSIRPFSSSARWTLGDPRSEPGYCPCPSSPESSPSDALRHYHGSLGVRNPFRKRTFPASHLGARRTNRHSRCFRPALPRPSYAVRRAAAHDLPDGHPPGTCQLGRYDPSAFPCCSVEDAARLRDAARR